MAFSEKELRFTFSGAVEGSFSASGLRAAANIQSTEGTLSVSAQVKIWGLSLAQMNAYSTRISAGINDEIPDANLVIEAGELGSSLSQVIDAPIWQSYIDLSGAPDSAFVVNVSSISDLATPAASQSQRGAQNAEDLIEAICAGVGLTFQNNGNAHCILRNPCTYGSALKQLDTIARAAGFHWIRNGSTLSIWSDDGTIDDVVIDVGPNTDPKMVGYPTFYENGIIVTSLFNPQVQVGRQMNVISNLKNANGLWGITSVQHNLTSMLPKGPWFTTATLSGNDA
jgi:hypothetical protein